MVHKPKGHGSSPPWPLLYLHLMVAPMILLTHEPSYLRFCQGAAGDALIVAYLFFSRIYLPSLPISGKIFQRTVCQEGANCHGCHSQDLMHVAIIEPGIRGRRNNIQQQFCPTSTAGVATAIRSSRNFRFQLPPPLETRAANLDTISRDTKCHTHRARG